MAANDNSAYWASPSKDKFNALWNSKSNSVLRVDTFVNRKYYLQSSNTSGNFDAFHAIRHVPTWGTCGSDYRITEGQGDFDQGNHYVYHDNGCMSHFEDNSAYDSNGTQYTVSRHGIPGDHRGGCEWIYTFEPNCSTQNGSYCQGQCHGNSGATSGLACVTKIYIKGTT